MRREMLGSAPSAVSANGYGLQVKPLTVPPLFTQLSGVLPEIELVQLLAAAVAAGVPKMRRPPPRPAPPRHVLFVMFVVPDRAR